MAEKQEVELFISEDGEVKVHIKGMRGPGCVKVLDTLTGKVGTEKERHLRREYYESQVNVNSKTQVKEK